MSIHIEVIANTETQKIIKILALPGIHSQKVIQQAIDTLTNNHNTSGHNIFDCIGNPDHKLVIIYK